MASERRWESLGVSQQKRYTRTLGNGDAAVARRQYESGASLSKARGHSSAETERLHRYQWRLVQEVGQRNKRGELLPEYRQQMKAFRSKYGDQALTERLQQVKADNGTWAYGFTHPHSGGSEYIADVADRDPADRAYADLVDEKKNPRMFLLYRYH